MKNNNYAWVTLLATDNFCGGVKMLNDSLKKVNSPYPLWVIATNNLAQSSFDFLEQENISYKIFPYVSFFCDGDRNLKYWGDTVNQRHNTWWNCTLSKNYMFLFTEFEKVIFVDADVEFIENCDNYFEYPIPATFDIQWSEGMHGGLILIKPNIEDFFKCMEIGCEPGVVNDEMVWLRWFPDFKQYPDHFFPYEDYRCRDDALYHPEDVPHYKLNHWDGPKKPWFTNTRKKNIPYNSSEAL